MTAELLSILLIGAVALATARGLPRARTRTQAASRRTKDDLELAAGFLRLGGTRGETATRIRSLANVHRLLSDGDEQVDAESLLETIAGIAPVPVTVKADAVSLDGSTARSLGVVVNELVTNAARHGSPPFEVRLTSDRLMRLRVASGGESVIAREGLGLRIVRGVVESELGGRFTVRPRRGGGLCAEVVFPAEPTRTLST